ncbi:MAG: single-stranded DNA-binding protein [Candidatus Diapherotrites archaeon]
MRGVNKVIIVGTVGRDPEVKTFENGEIVTFSLATNENYKDKNGNPVEKTEWHNIVIGIPNICEIAKKYVKKGDVIYVEGKINSRQYEKAEFPGAKFTAYEIKVNALTMISSKQRNTENTQDTNTEVIQAESSAEEDDLPF